MSEWKEYKLGEVAEIFTGFPFKGEKYSDEGIRVLRGENVTVGKLRWDTIKCWNEFFSQSPKYLLRKGDIVIGMDGSKVGKNRAQIKENDLPLLLAQRVATIRAKDEFCQDYLAQIIKSKPFEDFVDAVQTGTSIPHISQKQIEDFELQLPQFELQRAIANLLSSLDAKIDLLHRQNKTLDQLAETIFRQWFIVEAKEEWEVKSLSSIADFLNGLACQNFPPENEIDKLPVLKIRELSTGISENSDYASSKIDSKFIVNNGDIIFAWSASLMVKIWNGENCVLNQHLFKVSSDKFPKWFYYLWCKHHLEEFIAISKSHATTMGHIKRNDLDEAKALVPSEKELIEMNFQFEPLINKLISNSNLIRTLTQLREILLPKLMNGEIRVKF